MPHNFVSQDVCRLITNTCKECTLHLHCEDDQYCKDYTCLIGKAKGEDCSSDRQCLSVSKIE